MLYIYSVLPFRSVHLTLIIGEVSFEIIMYKVLFFSVLQ